MKRSKLCIGVLLGVLGFSASLIHAATTKQYQAAIPKYKTAISTLQTSLNNFNPATDPIDVIEKKFPILQESYQQARDTYGVLESYLEADSRKAATMRYLKKTFQLDKAYMATQKQIVDRLLTELTSKAQVAINKGAQITFADIKKAVGTARKRATSAEHKRTEKLLAKHLALIQKLQEEKAQLTTKIAGLEPEAAKVAALTTEKANLARQIGTLETELNTLHNAPAPVVDKTAINNLEQKVAQLNQQLIDKTAAHRTALKTAKINALAQGKKAGIEEGKANISNLKNKCSQNKQIIVDLKSKLANTANQTMLQVEALKTKNSKLTQNLKTLKNTSNENLAAEKQKTTQLKQQLENQTVKFNNQILAAKKPLEDKIRQLNNQVANIDDIVLAATRSLQKKIDHLTPLAQQAAHIDQKIAQAVKAKESELRTGPLAEATKRAADAEMKSNQLNSQLETVSKQLANANQKNSNLLEQQQQKLTAANAELEKSTTLISQLNNKLKSETAAKTAATKKLATLKKQVTSLKSANDQALKAEKNKYTVLEQRLSTQSAQIESLRAENAQLKQQTADIPNKITTAVKEKETELTNKYTQDLQDLNSQLTTAQQAAAKATQLENQLKEANKKANTFEGKLSASKAERGTLETQITKLETERDKLKTSLSQAEQNAADAQVAKTSALEQVNKLKTQLQNQKGAIDIATQLNNTLTASNESFKKRLERAVQKNTTLNKDYQAKLNALKQQLADIIAIAQGDRKAVINVIDKIINTVNFYLQQEGQLTPSSSIDIIDANIIDAHILDGQINTHIAIEAEIAPSMDQKKKLKNFKKELLELRKKFSDVDRYKLFNELISLLNAGNVDKVITRITTENIDPNLANKENYNLLMRAASVGGDELKLMRMLLAKGANPFAKNNTDKTMFDSAYKKLERINSEIEELKKVWVRSPKNRKRNASLIKQYAELVGTLQTLVIPHLKSNTESLLNLAQAGHEIYTQDILKNKILPFIKDSAGTALIKLVTEKANNLEKFIENNQRYTVTKILPTAFGGGENPDIIQLQKYKKTYHNVLNQLYQPWFTAAQKGMLSVTKAAIEGEHVDINKTLKGDTALMLAAQNNKKEIVEYLLTHGALRFLTRRPDRKITLNLTTDEAIKKRLTTVKTTDPKQWLDIHWALRHFIAPANPIGKDGTVAFQFNPTNGLFSAQSKKQILKAWNRAAIDNLLKISSKNILNTIKNGITENDLKKLIRKEMDLFNNRVETHEALQESSSSDDDSARKQKPTATSSQTTTAPDSDSDDDEQVPEPSPEPSSQEEKTTDYAAQFEEAEKHQEKYTDPAGGAHG